MTARKRAPRELFRCPSKQASEVLRLLAEKESSAREGEPNLHTATEQYSPEINQAQGLGELSIQRDRLQAVCLHNLVLADQVQKVAVESEQRGAPGERQITKKTFKKNNRSANSLSVFGKSIFMKPGQVNVDHHVLHIVCQPVIAHMTEDSARSRVTRSGTHPNSLDDACLSSKILVPKACPRRRSPPEALDVLKFTTVAIRTNWRHPKIIR